MSLAVMFFGLACIVAAMGCLVIAPLGSDHLAHKVGPFLLVLGSAIYGLGLGMP